MARPKKKRKYTKRSDFWFPKTKADHHSDSLKYTIGPGMDALTTQAAENMNKLLAQTKTLRPPTITLSMGQLVDLIRYAVGGQNADNR